MTSHEHHHNCLDHAPAQSSVHQSLEEMEFDHGIWPAALDGDLIKVEQFIKKDSSWVNRTDSAGYTALHYAARAGHLTVCEKLIKSGACIDAVTKAGLATPLHRAASSGKKDICRLLVEKGADVNKLDGDGNSALMRAKMSNRQDVVELLIGLGAV